MREPSEGRSRCPIRDGDFVVSGKSRSGKSTKVRPESSRIAIADDESTQFPPLETLTGFLLRCASNIAGAAYYKHVGNAEITPRQLAVLLSLRNGGQMTQAALSAVTRIDKSTINEMVPRMIERDLVTRSKSPDDKRAIHLSLTAHGLKTLKDLLPATILSQEMILAPLPKEYRRIFKHCLVTIIEANEAELAD
jgi:DNA-binding MarR family transcriptional regulator